MFLTLISQSSAHSPLIGKDEKALDAHSILRSSFEQLMKSDSGIVDEICRFQDVLNEKAYTCCQVIWFFSWEIEQGSTTRY